MTEAESLMRLIFLRAGECIDQWVAGMGGWNELPAQFDIHSERWIEAEAEIAKAANANNILEVYERGEAYIQRVRAYLSRWEAQMKRKAAV